MSIKEIKRPLSKEEINWVRTLLAEAYSNWLKHRPNYTCLSLYLGTIISIITFIILYLFYGVLAEPIGFGFTVLGVATLIFLIPSIYFDLRTKWIEKSNFKYDYLHYLKLLEEDQITGIEYKPLRIFELENEWKEIDYIIDLGEHKPYLITRHHLASEGDKENFPSDHFQQYKDDRYIEIFYVIPLGKKCTQLHESQILRVRFILCASFLYTQSLLACRRS